MDVSIISGLAAGLVLGMLGIIAVAGAPKVQRRPIPIKEENKNNRK